MREFWKRGYASTSMADLTEAMGINRPSLYAAFGCKEALFREAAEFYVASEGVEAVAALEEGATAREAIERLLLFFAKNYVEKGKPPGCMMVLSSLVGAPEDEEIRDFLAAARHEGISNVKKRLDRGVKDGDVPKKTDTAALAAYISTVTQGMSVQARDGVKRSDLERIVRQQMAVWDGLIAASQKA
ncbi:TetR family transcriptional regulator [Terrihabitans soli]|uniref:TetR family transcriptional regulator n=2 Tax=Terrihabitans soli TaxID=708113 RepID=A0A6S6QQV6_9HYPH|nr:TetR family transcriptional regulator [Terrihabitans soli]